MLKTAAILDVCMLYKRKGLHNYILNALKCTGKPIKCWLCYWTKSPHRYSPYFWLWIQSYKPTITVWSHYISMDGNITFSKAPECQWDLTHKSFRCFEIIYYIWTFSEGHSVTRTMFALLPMKDKEFFLVLTWSCDFQGFSN